MTVRMLLGDCREVLRTLPDASVHCCVTSPPYYGLRDYDVPPTEWPEVVFVPMAGLPAMTVPAMTCCHGLEPDPWSFIAHEVHLFREVRRVLRDDGTLWLNIGDSYANDSKWGGSTGGKHVKALHGDTGVGRRKLSTGLKGKDLIGIPWMLAFALRADGWYLRQDIIWSKPNPMPESVRDRCTKAHEYVFLLSKSPRYYYDEVAIAEPAAESTIERLLQPTLQRQAGSARVPGKTNGPMKAVGSTEMRNKRSVWTVATQPFKEAHFATFPPALIEPCVLAGCPAGGVVLDPFGGAGTTGLVADRLKRNAVLIELNPEYAAIARRRIYGPLFAEVAA